MAAAVVVDGTRIGCVGLAWWTGVPVVDDAQRLKGDAEETKPSKAGARGCP